MSLRAINIQLFSSRVIYAKRTVILTLTPLLLLLLLLLLFLFFLLLLLLMVTARVSVDILQPFA